MSTILVPVDFYSCSERLVREAVNQAKIDKLGLRLLHILRPASRDANALVTVHGGQRRSIRDHLRAEAKARLSRYDELLTPIESETVLVEGDAVAEILLAAAANDVSKVMMMTRGRGGLMRMLYGSVTEAVRKELTKPLMVIGTVATEACAAGSCATCSSEIGDARAQALAEEDG